MAAAEWESEVAHWVRWARMPGFDAYWHYRDAFFDEVVPPPAQRTVEIGCGEGRVARDLAARGHSVVALDGAAGLVRAARQEDVDGRYLVADGAVLPVASTAVDLVVAYNVLQVVDDLDGTVAECGRVLRSGGHLCFCIGHPMTDLGSWSDDDQPRLAVRTNYYLSERVDETVLVDDLTMTFRGWTHSLEGYVAAFARAGLLIELLSEPRPGPEYRDQRWARVPLFLNGRAIRR